MDPNSKIRINRSTVTKNPLAKQINRVVESGNCTGCGACALLSPGVEMKLDGKGYMRPNVDLDLVDVSRMSATKFKQVCPGVGIRARSAVPGGKVDPVVGPYFSAWQSYALDENTRHAGSSGGVLTALTSWMLEQGKYSEFVGARAAPEAPSRTVPVRIMTRAEALESAGSRYGPVANASLFQAEAGQGFIGKPCEASAVRQLLESSQSPEIGPIVLSFFCAGTPSQTATDALAEEIVGKRAKIASLKYRGDGWPGRFMVRTADGRSGWRSYEESWGQTLGRQLQTRCKLCVDGTGQDADVSVGDFWNVDGRGFPLFEDDGGNSVAIARTQRGHQLLVEAAAEGIIALDQVDLSRLTVIQPLQRDRMSTIPGRLLGRRLAGKPVPRYTGYGFVRRIVRNPKGNLRAVVGTWLRTVQGRM